MLRSGFRNGGVARRRRRVMKVGFDVEECDVLWFTRSIFSRPSAYDASAGISSGISMAILSASPNACWLTIPNIGKGARGNG